MKKVCPKCRRPLLGPRGRPPLSAATIATIRKMRSRGATVAEICATLRVGEHTVLKYAPVSLLTDRCAAIKAEIEAGTYETPEKLGRAAFKAIPHLLKPFVGPE